MSDFDFKRRINSVRPYGKEQDLTIAVESDRGRIINSAAVRRLQQKTQVFPLERNAAVRSRLTHSLEVQQVGRFITQQIFVYLSEKGKLAQYGLENLENATQSMVEMACLMHDIGNPPFGHFGEKAINDWFKQNIELFFPQLDNGSVLEQKVRQDIQTFEGNAQAIRLIFSLLRLNLTYSQTAAVLKYTRPAYLARPKKGENKDYLMKKPGYYLSEEKQVEALRTHLDLEFGCRHPLTYIMEAADDISYCFADIEDAVEKGILTVEQLISLLTQAYQKQGFDPDKVELHSFKRKLSFAQLLKDAKDKYDSDDLDKNNRFFVSLRVGLQHALVTHARFRFTYNIAEIFNGTFNQALLEDNSPAHGLTEAFKTVAFEKVFSHSEVELQELRGYEILHGLLEYYQPLLTLSCETFTLLLEKNSHACRQYAREHRLINKLPDKHIRAYAQGIEQYRQQQEFPVWERYYRCRLMQDFVSGMTDQFAYDEFKRLTVRD